MNAVEIEKAVSDLAEATFDAEAFPYDFLAAFGNKAITINRLRSAGKSTTNKTDLDRDGVLAVLQRNNIHLATCTEDRAADTLAALLDSPATAKQKAKFALATDGRVIHAQNLADESEPPLVCNFDQLGDHFGYFLALAGISTVRQIRENAFDIKATGRLNRLYVELLKHNEAWSTDARRADLNHFFARLIFCFFAEDTGIFHGVGLFTATLGQMTEPDGSNTHAVLGEVFRAMDVPAADRDAADLPNWANAFPYVNGGLFAGSGGADDVPRFTRTARSYLLYVGSLDWTKINPDIFGSMIQAVADDAERGALGMHYTSVPNILKVLNPLFLDDLRDKLEKAGDRPQALRHLRRRLARIRVFDPACGSGNFLVIAYKHMRQIEATINERLGEPDRPSDIPPTNFRGIELRHFAAEIARLALVIAEYQCDVLHRGQTLAMAEFLPLDEKNWITCGNALRLDWLSICPPTGVETDVVSEHMFEETQTQARIDFQNEGGETYICGNPPYKGSKSQTDEQKDELRHVVDNRDSSWKSLDYVAGWFIKAAGYGRRTSADAAFVATNSICQGIQVPILWPIIRNQGYRVSFAHTSFKWANLASHNAGVTVVVVGITRRNERSALLFEADEDGQAAAREVGEINYYLVPGRGIDIVPTKKSISNLSYIDLGNMPKDGGNLILSFNESLSIRQTDPIASDFILDFVGSQEFIRGTNRRCIWINDDDLDTATLSPFVRERLEGVRKMRAASKAASTRAFADRPHRFKQIQGRAEERSIIIPKITSESRDYLPVGVLPPSAVISDAAFAIYDAPLWNLALIASRLHLVWVATVCGKLKTDYRYSNTLGWNTFPVPPLSEQNKADLTRRAEDILLAREAHWPATIADLYDPAHMPADLRRAHDANDETLERIYLGRRFKNDTERLEHLFALYTRMTADAETSRVGFSPPSGKGVRATDGGLKPTLRLRGRRSPKTMTSADQPPPRAPRRRRLPRLAGRGPSGRPSRSSRCRRRGSSGRCRGCGPRGRGRGSAGARSGARRCCTGRGRP